MKGQPAQTSSTSVRLSLLSLKILSLDSAEHMVEMRDACSSGRHANVLTEFEWRYYGRQ
jgi:hypothetical protein